MKKFFAFMLTLLTVVTLGATLRVNAATGDTYVKATSIDELRGGVTIALANETKASIAANYDGSKKMEAKGTKFESGKVHGISTNDEFTLEFESKTSNNVNIKHSTKGYLVGSDGADIKKSTNAPSTYEWTIKQDSTGLYFDDSATAYSRGIRYNGSSIKNYSKGSYPIKAYIYVKEEFVGTTYDTNFHYENGTNKIETVTTVENGTIQVPTAPIYKGFIFEGWYDQKVGGNKIADGVTATKDGIKDYYARWTAKEEFVVTLVYNDGITPNVQLTGNEDDECIIPESLTKEGYKFLGWFDQEIDGKKITSTTFTSNQTLYAHWEKLPEGNLYIDFINTPSGQNGYKASRTFTVSGVEFVLTPGLAQKGLVTMGTKDNTDTSTSKLVSLAEYGIEGNGTVLKVSNDSSNVKSVEYTCAKTYEEGQWAIFFTETNGKPVQISTGNVTDMVYRAELPEAKNGRFTLVAYPTDQALDKFRLQLESYSLTVENPVVAPTFENVETRSSLIVTYDDKTRVATKVRIRFGGIIDAQLYDANKEYGIIILDGTNTDDLNTLTMDMLNAYKASGNAKVAEPAKVKDGYQFAGVISNLAGHYDHEFRAVMYVLDGETITVSKEARNSVLSVRDIYLANPNLASLKDVLNSIK